MKHPLTSKERRGLTAVAAAALLCIASGPLLRSGGCNRSASQAVEKQGFSGSQHSGNPVNPASDALPDTTSIDRKSKSRNPKPAKNANKKNRTKTYPTRHPLDQPVK